MGDQNGESFPAANVDAELNPGHNTSVQPDSVSSEISTSRQMKDEDDTREKQRQQDKKDTIQTLKKAVLVSAVIVAVAGAAFAITKKLKEK